MIAETPHWYMLDMKVWDTDIRVSLFNNRIDYNCKKRLVDTNKNNLLLKNIYKTFSITICNMQGETMKL